MANVSMPRSQLTFSQQGQVRANLMRSAQKIVHQIDEFLETNRIVVAGREIPLTPERLNAYRMILNKTVPDLKATEVTHRSGLEGLDSGKLVERLTRLAKENPELRTRLYEALGGRLIDGEATAAEPKSERNEDKSA